jgi:hypothetical protein
MKVRYILFFIVLGLSFTACSLDNYDLPQESIQGKLIDKNGDAFISEQPNGYKIQLYEGDSPEKFSFWGKADGTYKNTKIFKGTYSIQPIEGAFFPVEPKKMNIKGSSIVDFEVVPFLYITATIINSNRDVKATYRITQSPGAGKIKMARLLVSKWNPNVGMNYLDFETTRALDGTSDTAITGTDYIDYVRDILVSVVTYYARVAVLAENTSGRYNFSSVTKIVVP